MRLLLDTREPMEVFSAAALRSDEPWRPGLARAIRPWLSEYCAAVEKEGVSRTRASSANADNLLIAFVPPKVGRVKTEVDFPGYWFRTKTSAIFLGSERMPVGLERFLAWHNDILR